MSTESCGICEYKSYPSSYSLARQSSALVVIVSWIVLLLGGLVIFAFRKNERTFAAHTHFAIYFCACNLAIALIGGPIREYVGEARYPCVVQLLISCAYPALIPASIIIRIFGSYARHLRQALTLVEASPANARRAALGAATPLHGSCYACKMTWFDSLILRTRLYTEKSQMQTIAWCCAPWTLFYCIRLALDPPSRTLGAVGCRSSSSVFIVSVVAVVIYAALLLPVFLKLSRTRDSLYLRQAVLIELIVSPFIAAWFLYSKLVPEFEFNTVSGGYAILVYNAVVFTVATWMPGVLSFRRSERIAPVSQ